MFGDGVNSDYYPLVDQAAPMARFAGDTANGLMRTATAPIPVMELLGDPGRSDIVIADNAIWPPLRRSLAGSAKETIAFLRTGVTAGLHRR